MTDTPTIDHARRLLATGDEELVVRSHPQSFFDLLDPDLLKSALAAIVLLALVDLDAFRTESLFDPLDLLLRLFALAAVARLAIGAVRFVRRLRSLRRSGDALVRVDDDLVLFAGVEPRVFRRSDIVLVRTDEELGTRRKRVVVLLAPPSVPTLLVLPEALAAAPEALVRRLERWADEGRGPEPDDEKESPATRGPHRRTPVARGPEAVAELKTTSASATYDAACAGRALQGTAAFPAGYRWIARGPYAALLFVVVFAERLSHAPRAANLGPLPLAALAICVLLPLAWWRLARREARARGKAAFVTTPDELLRRSHAGMLRVRWDEVLAVMVDARWSWTALEGVHKRRNLVIERAEGEPVRVDEATMGLSVETARALVEAYRAGAFVVDGGVAASGTPPSHGNGGGGGISGADDTTT